MSVLSSMWGRSRRVRASLILSAMGALPAAGQQVSTWDPGVLDGLWSKPASWLGGQVPVAGSEVRLNASGDGEITARFDAGTSPTYGAMYLQYAGTGTARFTLRVDDPLAHLVSQSMSVGSIGSGGSARVVQTQGRVAAFGMSLGDGEKASGGYELSGGTLVVERLSVGMYGTGTFDQSGGGITFSRSDGIDVGVFAGSRGTFTLSGGDAMTVPVLHVGMAGTGSFAQHAGSITVAPVSSPPAGFVVGSAAGGVGTYELYAGASLATYGDATVGGDGAGTFNQYGGTNSTSGQRGLILGDGATGDGTYHLYDGSLTTSFDIGHSSGARGLFKQSGGSVSAIGTNVGVGGSGRVEVSGGTFTTSGMNLGSAAGGNGSFELSAGTLTVTGRQTVGGAGTGSFVQTGGTNSVKELWLGAPAGGESSYSLSGGQLKVASSEYVANGGTVRFVQSGGTNTAVDFRVGNGSGADGEYDLKGGDLTVGQLVVGQSGKGQFVYSGGRITFTGNSGLKLGGSAGSGSFTMTVGAADLSIPFLGVTNGTLEHAAGTITLTSPLPAPGLSLASGTYNLREGASLATSSWGESIGGGTFNQYGGANTVNGGGWLTIGSGSGSGTYNLSGGTLTANINLTSAGALLHQTGGSLIAGRVSLGYGATLDLDGAAADFRTTDLVVGYTWGGNVKMRAGAAHASGTLSVESYAGSHLDQTGGTLTVGKLTVGASGTPGGTVTLQGGLLEAGTIDVQHGALTQTGGTLRAGGMTLSGGAVTLGGVQEWASGSTLTATGGTLTLSTDAGSAQGPSLGVDVNGATAVFGGRQHLRSVHVGAGAVVTSGDVLETRELQVDGTGRLDLNRGGLVVDYAAGGMSPLAGVVASILSGRAGGTWDGPGVTSSVAASTSGVAIGYAEAVQLLGPSGGAFMGEAVDATAVLARVTRAGDANLDGVVNFDDLLALAKHYGGDVSTAAGGAWLNGDYTYDGLVNFDDLLALAKNYGAVAPSEGVPGGSAAFQADVAEAFAAVPEPAMGGFIGGLLAWCVTRRGRRRR